jgi:hypothetical protein
LAEKPYKGTVGLRYYSCLSNDGRAFCEIERRFSAHMDAPRTDGTRETARGIVWTELAREGDANSINTYDSQGMTWGRGFAAGGTLHRMIWLLFSLVPGLRAQFNAVGLDGDGKKVYIVDDRTGEVLSGKEGFRRHRRDRRISSFLIQKGKEHPDELLRAELDTLASGGGALDVPDFALRWDKRVLQFVGHCVHWYSSLFAWKRWEPTGGDFREVLGFFVKRLVEHTERGNYSEDQYHKFGHGRRVGAAFILDGEQACRYVFGDRAWRSLVDGYFGPPGPLPVFPSGVLVGIPAKDAQKSYLPRRPVAIPPTRHLLTGPVAKATAGTATLATSLLPSRPRLVTLRLSPGLAPSGLGARGRCTPGAAPPSVDCPPRRRPPSRWPCPQRRGGCPPATPPDRARAGSTAPAGDPATPEARCPLAARRPGCRPR